MRSISIKHRNSWPDSPETLVLDCEEVKFIVFHGTMFGDDDVDVYGIISPTGEQVWVCIRYLSKADYVAFTQWLKVHFDVVSVLNEDEPPPVIVWPAEYAGSLFFEPSFVGRFIGEFWVFPGCYENRVVVDRFVG
jgi:hypothetical protein